jgi:hypothetical protein
MTHMRLSREFEVRGGYVDEHIAPIQRLYLTALFGYPSSSHCRSRSWSPNLKMVSVSCTALPSFDYLRFGIRSGGCRYLAVP